MADDDTYINIPNLVYTLAQYDHTKDWYIGKPSLKYPIRVNINNRVTESSPLCCKDDLLMLYKRKEIFHFCYIN